jgi:hypothetical protein
MHRFHTRLQRLEAQATETPSAFRQRLGTAQAREAKVLGTVRRLCEHYEAYCPITEEEQTIRIGDCAVHKRFPEAWSLQDRLARALGWTTQELRHAWRTDPGAIRARVQARIGTGG